MKDDDYAGYKDLIEFWSKKVNVDSASGDDIQSDILGYVSEIIRLKIGNGKVLELLQLITNICNKETHTPETKVKLIKNLVEYKNNLIPEKDVMNECNACAGSGFVYWDDSWGTTQGGDCPDCKGCGVEKNKQSEVLS